MADIQQKSLNLQDKQTEATGPMATSGVVTPGAPTGAPAMSRTAQFSTGTPQASGSGRFTNIRNYIEANKPAGEQLGQKIASGVQQGVSKTEKQASTQAGQIAEQIGKEKARIGEAAGFAEQVKQDPTKITSDTAARNRFQQLASGTTSADQLQQQTQQAQAQAASQFGQVGQQVAGLGTETGRFNLLKQTVRQPGYSTGQQRLDQLFLQTANPQALAQRQQALQQQVQGAQAGIEAAYKAPQFTEAFGQEGLASQAQKAQQELQKSVTGEIGTFEKAQAEEAANLSKQREASNAALNQFFTNGYQTLSDEQKSIIDPILAEQGLRAGMRTYGGLGDKERYINVGKTGLSSADVINPEELSRIQALQQLMGIAPDEYTYTKAGDIGQATGLNANLLSDIEGSRQGFEADIAGKQASTQIAGGDIPGSASIGMQDLLNLQSGRTPLNLYGALQGVTYNPITSTYGYSANPENGFETRTETIPLTQADYKAANDALMAQLNDYLTRQYYTEGLGGVSAPVPIPGMRR